ncbi:MAG: undecaprenyl-diphosphatase UppP [Anaerolineae bacterium]
MTLWQAILLGILQGATEFLPISSSGHLVIVPHLLGWPDPGLVLDTMLHMGTLLAVVVYFWAELWRLVKAAVVSLRRHSLSDPQARIAWGIAVATIPGAVGGFLLEDTFERLFGMPRAAAAFLLGTAALLVLAEYVGSRVRPVTSLSWIDAILIGVAQTLAIAPGISRSGSTISAAVLLGFRREDATQFSFLLGVPIILGTGLYQLLKLLMGTTGTASLEIRIVVAGVVASALAGYLAIAGLLALVRRRGLYIFAAYCAVFGLLVLSGVLG